MPRRSGPPSKRFLLSPSARKQQRLGVLTDPGSHVDELEDFMVPDAYEIALDVVRHSTTGGLAVARARGILQR